MVLIPPSTLAGNFFVLTYSLFVRSFIIMKTTNIVFNFSYWLQNHTESSRSSKEPKLLVGGFLFKNTFL